VDITQLILDDHHEQRRLFAILEQIDRSDTESLSAVWNRLAAFLDTHEVSKHPVGSNGWFKAIAGANEANGDHMAEEEREGLTDFRRITSLQHRHDLAVAFTAYEARHVLGVEPVDKDPKTYIRQAESAPDRG
jgi:hypothetical protein